MESKALNFHTAAIPMKFSFFAELRNLCHLLSTPRLSRALAPCLKAYMREKGHSLNMGYRVFSAGQYKIRQRGNRYYVYKIEKDSKGNVSERYIGPLDKIMEFYYKKGLGPGFEPGTSGSTARRSSRLSYPSQPLFYIII